MIYVPGLGWLPNSTARMVLNLTDSQSRKISNMCEIGPDVATRLEDDRVNGDPGAKWCDEGGIAGIRKD